MGNKIHPTAIISKKAELGDRIEIGPYSVVEDGATISDHVKIGAHVFIDKDTKIAQNCHIYHHATVGSPPQDLKYKDEKTFLEIGENTTIREYADLNRGTDASGKTTVGSNVLIMAYVHVAHDCVIGDRCILANAVNLAGHVEIDEFVIVGGMVPVHQFVKIGKHSMVGGGYRVTMDIPPFVTAAGDPLSFHGLNSLGLQRRGFSNDKILKIKRFYKEFYDPKLQFSQILQKINKEFDRNDSELSVIFDFIEKSNRGIIHYKRRARND